MKPTFFPEGKNIKEDFSRRQRGEPQVASSGREGSLSIKILLKEDNDGE